jgi:hypothetical protein
MQGKEYIFKNAATLKYFTQGLYCHKIGRTSCCGICELFVKCVDTLGKRSSWMHLGTHIYQCFSFSCIKGLMSTYISMHGCFGPWMR